MGALIAMSIASIQDAVVTGEMHTSLNMARKSVTQKRPAEIAISQKSAVAAFLSGILNEEDIEIPEAAKRAGVSASTLYRIVDETDQFTPSLRTVGKIETAFNRSFAARGLEESEASPYKLEQTDLDHLIREFIGGRQGVDPWKLNTRAVELAGWVPGDIVVLDMNARPRSGDLVCAQVYDLEKSKAETIWRLYEPPYLVAASADRARFRTERDDKALIKGVVLATFRPRP